MLNNLLFITNLINDFKETVMWIAILLLVIFAIYIFIKFPIGRKIICVILGILFIASGVLTTSANFEYFSIRGGIWGTIEGVFNKNEVAQNNLTFNFTNFNLIETLNPDEFNARFSVKNVDINLNDKVVYVNDIPTVLVQRGSNYIFADYKYSFNDEDIKEICNDTLSIKFVFNSAEIENPETGELEKADTSICILTSYGGLQKAKYWNEYLKKNGLKIEIKTEDFKTNEDLNIEQLPTKYVYYYDIEGNLIEDYTEQIALNNYPFITLKNCATVDGAQYPLWRSSDNELISEDNLIYECSEYKDLHFYLFNHSNVIVDMKISQNLMNEFNSYYTEWRNFLERQDFYTTYNFANFYFTLHFNNGETRSAAVWPMEGHVRQYTVPKDLFITGPTLVSDLENVEFNNDDTYLNHTCYENLTYSIEIKSIECAGVNFPKIEIKLFNNNEDINTLQWGAQSGYIFEEWN